MDISFVAGIFFYLNYVLVGLKQKKNKIGIQVPTVHGNDSVSITLTNKKLVFMNKIECVHIFSSKSFAVSTHPIQEYRSIPYISPPRLCCCRIFLQIKYIFCNVVRAHTTTVIDRCMKKFTFPPHLTTGERGISYVCTTVRCLIFFN